MKLPCFESCLVCFGTKLNECTMCAPGFALHKGFCIECSSGCRDCIGINDSSCTSCSLDRTLSKFGQCLDCHPSCKTCLGTEEDRCSSCFDDSTLLDNIGDDYGQCICDIPTIRHPGVNMCAERCPTGMRLDNV
jgi:hypothetical protein